MSESSFYPRSGLAAMVAGLVYVIETSLGLLKPQADVFPTPTDYMIEIAFVGALLLTLVAFLGLRQAVGAGMFRMLSFSTLTIGTLLLLVAASASLASGHNVPGLLFLAGVVLSLLGIVLVGVALIRAQVLPLWGGAVLMTGFPIALLLGNFGGGMVLGLAWIIVGFALLAKTKAKLPVLPSRKMASEARQ